MSARRKAFPTVTVEVPGLAYYAPVAANAPTKPLPALTALEQMYAYWTRA